MPVNIIRLAKGASLLILLTLLGSGCIAKSFIYYPETNVIATPADVGLPFEDLHITTEDRIQINAWYVPSKGSERSLLWFHGNAGNMGNRVNLLQRLHHELKINILIIDYRGYGRSSGDISEEGTGRDARAAYDYLLSRSDINPGQIFIFGRSLGAAVAVELATESRAAGLILEAPFSSVRSMASHTFPWLPFKKLISIKYDSLSKMYQVHTPLLLMHGDQDRVVPFKEGQALFEAANAPKTFYAMRGADHDNSYLVDGSGYFKTLLTFIDGLIK